MTSFGRDITLKLKPWQVLLAFAVVSVCAMDPESQAEFVAMRGGLAQVYEFFSAFPQPDAFIWLAPVAVVLAFLIARMCQIRPIKGKVGLIVGAVFFGFAMVFGHAFDAANDVSMYFQGAAQFAKMALGWVAWGFVFFCAVSVLFDWLDSRGAAGAEGEGEAGAEVGEAKTKGAGIASVAAAAGVDDAASADDASPVVAEAAAGPAAEADADTSAPAKRNPVRRVVGRFFAWFSRHAFAGPAVVFAVLWLPLLIGYAPGLFMGDTATQLPMSHNLPNWLSELTVLSDPNVYITTAHPVVHTFLLGFLFDIGRAVFGSDSMGFFTYTLFQYAVTVLAFAYASLCLRRMGVRAGVVLAVCLVVALNPALSIYVVLATKDTLFADAFLVFCVQSLELVWTRGARPTRAQAALLIVSAVLAALFRSGSWLFIICGLVAFVCVGRKRVAAVALACAAAVVVAYGGLTYAIVPALHISVPQSSPLAMVYQQVARYVIEYPDDLTPEEYAAIDKVLRMDDLADRYNPDKVDPVSEAVTLDVTADDFAAFNETWKALGQRHPEVYVEATMNFYYGYFYVTSDAARLNYDRAWSAECMRRVEDNFDVHHFDNRITLAFATFDIAYQRIFYDFPFISLLGCTAFYSWVLILLTLYAARNRRWAWMAALVPLWLVLLVNLVGPDNGNIYFRYAYPLAVVLSFIPALLDSKVNRENVADNSGL